MADAIAKAEQMAKLAGVTLGKPTYISESIQVPPPIYPRAVYEAGAPVPAAIRGGSAFGRESRGSWGKIGGRVGFRGSRDSG